jgi:hypothetical protein
MLTISVGQALLILIANLKTKPKTKANSKKLNRLIYLYVCGVSTDAKRKELFKLLESDTLKDYIISTDPEVITEDASRRYFETHLAFETLKNTLPKLSLDSLKIYNELCRHFLKGYFYERSTEDADRVLAGQVHDYEYSELIHRTKNEYYFQDFSEEDRKKIELLAASAFYVIIMTNHFDEYLPIPIFFKGVFSSSQRGRKLKEVSRDNPVLGHHLGIMKTYMPLSSADLAYTEQRLSHTRGINELTYDLNAAWVKDNFKYLVHPFVTSTSGSMLAEVRVLNYYFRKNTLPFKNINELGTFVKSFVSAMTFYCGGHSLHEFLAPLAMPEVKAAFLKFPRFKNLTIYDLFCDRNKLALNAALDKALQYNCKLMERKKLLESVRNFDKEQSLQAVIKSPEAKSSLFSLNTLYNFFSARGPSLRIREEPLTQPALKKLKQSTL